VPIICFGKTKYKLWMGNDNICGKFCELLFSVLSAFGGPSECEVNRASKRYTVLFLIGEYCFVMIEIARDKLVISCYVSADRKCAICELGRNLSRGLEICFGL
jgi:hypothetical protein